MPTRISPPCLQQELAGATARLPAAEAGGGSARLHRPAGARARSDRVEPRGPPRTCSRSSRGSSSTNSRTPIRSRPRSCCCSPTTSAASCSSSATRSRRSTASAAPTSAPTGRCATSSSARGGRVLQLTTSYRSVPAIQRFVNAAFAPEMTGDARTRQADYVALGPARPADDSQPAIVALPVPKPYGRGGFGCSRPRRRRSTTRCPTRSARSSPG